jgi:hypothetical protein
VELIWKEADHPELEQGRELRGKVIPAWHVLTTTTFNIAELQAGIRPGEDTKTEAVVPRNR